MTKVTKEFAISARKSAYKLILCQIIMAGLVTLAFFILKDPLAAKSALKGGLVAVVPNVVFVFFAFRYSGAEIADKVIASFMRGHSLKILLTVVLCGLVLTQETLLPMPFFSGFLLTLLTQWTAPFFFKH